MKEINQNALILLRKRSWQYRATVPMPELGPVAEHGY